MNATTRQHTTFETARGFCAIGWSAAGVGSFQLPASTAPAAEARLLRRSPGSTAAKPPPEIAQVIATIRRYFDGERTSFGDVRLDLDGQEAFFARIYAALREVGWGETTTYGALAKQLGAGPGAARDVGQAMARNPVPLIIPCHRVLAAGNRIGGFSAPGGSDSKVWMLALEGVTPAPAKASKPPQEPPTQGRLGF